MCMYVCMDVCVCVRQVGARVHINVFAFNYGSRKYYVGLSIEPVPPQHWGIVET